MTSKELRQKTGISRDTLRHYVDCGLLHPQRNPHNGYRTYTVDDIRRIDFILRAKDLGFCLADILSMTRAMRGAPCPHKSVLPALEKNLTSVKQKIKDLNAIKKHLTYLIADFEKRNCTTHPTKFEL